MNKIIIGLCAISMAIASIMHASAGQKAVVEIPEKEKFSLAQAAPIIVPDHILKALGEKETRLKTIEAWIQENPQRHINALIFHDGDPLCECIVNHMVRWDKPIVDNPEYQRFISVFLAYKPNVYFEDARHKRPDFLLTGAMDAGQPLTVLKTIVDLFCEQGAQLKDIQDIITHYYVHLLSNRHHGLSSEKKKQIDRDIVMLGEYVRSKIDNEKLDAAGKTLDQFMNTQVFANILIPSKKHIRAIKHAIEDMTEDVMQNQHNPLTNLNAALKDGGDWLEVHDATGYTPFLYAAYLGKKSAMRYLISVGADVKAKTNNGVGATYFDKSGKDKNEYQKLINEERVKKERNDAEEATMVQVWSDNLFKAIYEKDRDPYTIKLHAILPAMNVKDSQGRTPLIASAMLGRIDFVERLLMAGANTALTDNDRDTALHAAATEGHYTIANVLLPKMSPEAIAAKNDNGFTALDLVVRQEAQDKDKPAYQLVAATLKAMAEKDKNKK